MSRSALQLHPALQERVRAHLEQEYAGVFPKSWVPRHIEEYVEGGEAESFLDEVVIRSPGIRNLLDVGCGYGAFVTLARLRGIESLGVDLASFELSIARERAKQLLPKVDVESTFREASALDLPFAEGSFDCVTMWNLLEHLDDAESAIAEAARVLRPEGRLFIVAPNYASFRSEAHYHVPWLPLFPRRLASRYLRALGRESRFFDEQIYYRTNREVRKILGRQGLHVVNRRAEKLKQPELIRSRRLRAIASVVASLRLSRPVGLALSLALRSPFKRAISVEAVRS